MSTVKLTRKNVFAEKFISRIGANPDAAFVRVPYVSEEGDIKHVSRTLHLCDFDTGGEWLGEVVWWKEYFLKHYERPQRTVGGGVPETDKSVALCDDINVRALVHSTNSDYPVVSVEYRRGGEMMYICRRAVRESNIKEAVTSAIMAGLVDVKKANTFKKSMVTTALRRMTKWMKKYGYVRLIEDVDPSRGRAVVQNGFSAEELLKIYNRKSLDKYGFSFGAFVLFDKYAVDYFINRKK